MFKVIAVIPVKGRFPLLKRTIERLYEKNGIFKVICIGDTKEERELCEGSGAEFIKHPNNPLGKKWNAGFIAAKKYNPDACLFVGSSDWVSDDWIPTLMPNLKDFDLVGKPDFNLLDVGKELRLLHWPGYGPGPRETESIGIGRLLSRRILDKMSWEPMENHLDSSLDWSMKKRVAKFGGKSLLVRGKAIQSLSVSTDRWENKHKFEEHYTNKLPSSKIEDHVEWLYNWFPEGLNIF